MAGFIQNIIWNSVEGFVEAGKKSAGEYAGNALIKAGDMIENGGRNVGNGTFLRMPIPYKYQTDQQLSGIEKKATSYGSSITGQTYQSSPKALPSTARKPVIKRSNSSPASSKPLSTNVKKPTSSVPLGANKYPGGNQVNGARKAITNGTGAARSTAGGTTKSLGGVPGGIIGGGSKALSSTTSTAKGPISKASAPTRSNSLPKPYGTNNAFPSSDKKTAVRPGAPKPFTPPVEQKKAASTAGGYGGGDKKPYPGAGSKVPVQQQKTKALPRLGPQVGQGQTMTHLKI